MGKGSFHGQVIDLMGDNVALFPVVLTTGGGNETNLEQILNWNPEYIIADRASYNAVLKNPVWQAVPAVKEKKIYQVPDQPYSWVTSPPAVNRFLGLLWLAKFCTPTMPITICLKKPDAFINCFTNRICPANSLTN